MLSVGEPNAPPKGRDVSKCGRCRSVRSPQIANNQLHAVAVAIVVGGQLVQQLNTRRGRLALPGAKGDCINLRAVGLVQTLQ